MCARRADAELAGLGEAAAGEWREWRGVYHLRRRLSAAEAVAVGPVRDIRATAEARARLRALPRSRRRILPPELLIQEAGTDDL